MGVCRHEVRLRFKTRANRQTKPGVFQCRCEACCKWICGCSNCRYLRATAPWKKLVIDQLPLPDLVKEIVFFHCWEWNTNCGIFLSKEDGCC